MSDNLKDRIARMRAWQAFETEDFRATDLEAVLSAAETPADQGKPQIIVTEQMVEAGARILAGLSNNLWMVERNTPFGLYYTDAARAVLEAALGKGGE